MYNSIMTDVARVVKSKLNKSRGATISDRTDDRFALDTYNKKNDRMRVIRTKKNSELFINRFKELFSDIEVLEVANDLSGESHEYYEECLDNGYDIRVYIHFLPASTNKSKSIRNLVYNTFTRLGDDLIYYIDETSDYNERGGAKIITLIGLENNLILNKALELLDICSEKMYY